MSREWTEHLYLLFWVLVSPVIWLMMEALEFTTASLDRFGLTKELDFTVKLTDENI